ncbi:MAG: PilZ domain-containing protein [Planctomycetes bacterium]|nr:PilZ domain-containing protein [Planctomycetota bacterium]
MSAKSKPSADSRQSPRVKLPAMYTLVRVRPEGKERFCWTGYIYDISSTGMRLELDRGLAPGTRIEFRAMLPGASHTTFSGNGHVVRMHDDVDEPGPVRMGLVIDRFSDADNRRRLSDYLGVRGIAA